MTSGISSWLEQFVNEDLSSVASTRRFYVMSAAHFHGVWEVLLKFAYETHEVKQDFADALLEEAFYLGYDYGDDWFPIMDGITPAVMLEWRLQRRDGLVIPSYSPAKLWPLLLGKPDMGHTIFETDDDRKGECKVLAALSDQLGMDLFQTGKLSRWDGYLPSTDVYNPKPAMIFEIKRRSYPWEFFLKEGIILTGKKFEGLLQQHRTGIDPILVVEAQGEIRWVNVARVDSSQLRYDKAKCDRSDVPRMAEVVILDGSVFKDLKLLKGAE